MIGLIGIGLLGSALAERLLDDGHSVLGFDTDAQRMQWLAAKGGSLADNVQTIAPQCSQIVLSLPDSHIVQRVVEQMLELLPAESLVIDTTTGSPEHAEQTAGILARRQVHYAEVTIAGSSEQVRQQTALAMIGAEPALLPRIEELTKCWTSRTILVGVPGQAARMKLTVNLALGLHRAVLAEALAFAAAQGLDERLALEVLQASPAHSHVMDTKGAKMLSGDYAPQARLRQHLKDVQLILDQAQRCDIALPLSDVHRALLEKGVTLNLGDLDNSAIRLVYSRQHEGVARPPDEPQ